MKQWVSIEVDLGGFFLVGMLGGKKGAEIAKPTHFAPNPHVALGVLYMLELHEPNSSDRIRFNAKPANPAPIQLPQIQ